MKLSTSAMGRRQLLRGLAGALGTTALSSLSLPAMAQARAADAVTLHVTQLLDMSPDQQQLSRDYSTGIRLAFAEMRKAGLAAPQLSTVETDGSAASARSALQALQADATQVALLGTAGEGLALASMTESA